MTVPLQFVPSTISTVKVESKRDRKQLTILPLATPK